MAVHKELGGNQSKKKMSRLKRIILRERADKAATQASSAAEQAAEVLTKSKTALESLQKQLKVWFHHGVGAVPADQEFPLHLSVTLSEAYLIPT